MQELETSLKVYEGASSAKVNWGKSKALLCGAWGDRAPPLLPGGLQWGCDELKVLGVEPGLWEELIFHNPAIPLRSVQSATLQRQLMAGGLQRLGDLRLLGEEGWKTLEVLPQQAGLMSLRLLERFLEEVQQALSEPVRMVYERPKGEGTPMFPPLQVTAETRDWQGSLEDLLDFNTLSPWEYKGAGGKALYNRCSKVRNIRRLTGVKAHQWQGYVG